MNNLSRSLLIHCCVTCLFIKFSLRKLRNKYLFFILLCKIMQLITRIYFSCDMYDSITFHISNLHASIILYGNSYSRNPYAFGMIGFLNFNGFTESTAWKVSFSEFFWSVFSRIWTEHGDLLCETLHSVQMQEIRTRKFLNTDNL